MRVVGARKFDVHRKIAAVFSTSLTTGTVLPIAILSQWPLLLAVVIYFGVWIVLMALGAIWFGPTVDGDRYCRRGEGGAAVFETVVRYDRSPELLEQIVESATRNLLQENPNYDIAEKEPRFVAIDTATSIWSWGETITMYVEGKSIRVRSECTLPMQFIDWNKNRTNVGRAHHSLLQISADL